MSTEVEAVRVTVWETDGSIVQIEAYLSSH
jgi:hypothetical protein